MLGIGMPEIIMILGIALIVVGPSKLPDLAKTIAKGLNEFRKVTEEVKITISKNESFKDLEQVKSSIQETIDYIKPINLLTTTEFNAKPEVTPIVIMKKNNSFSARPEPKIDILENKKIEEKLTNRIEILDKIAREYES